MPPAVQHLDAWLFLLVNDGCSTRALDFVMPWLSELGAWSIALVALAVLGLDGARRLGRHVLLLALFVVLVSASSNVLKGAVNRDRPVRALAPEIAAGTARVHVLDEDALQRRSFPSGHAMLAFFFLTYAGQWKRRWRPFLLLLATAIAFARVYVGSHFPLDAMAGSAIGVAWGLAAWHVSRRFIAAPACYARQAPTA